MQHGLAYTTRVQPVDLSDPLHPVVDPSAKAFEGSEYTQIDIDPLTHTLYASSTDTIAVYDITNPNAPDRLYDQRLYSDSYNYRSARIGSLLFVNGRYPSDMRVFDASSAEGLTELTLTLDLDEGEGARFIQLIDGVFYNVTDTRFSAYSISTSPYTAAHRTEGSTNDILRYNDLVITSEEGFGIELFDASDPANLKLVGRYGGLDSVSAVAASGDTLYLAADRDDLVVLDITDPANPTLLRTIDTGRRARDAAVVDGTLFIVDRTSGLSIFDITDPTDPRLRAYLDTPGWNEASVSARATSSPASPAADSTRCCSTSAISTTPGSSPPSPRSTRATRASRPPLSITASSTPPSSPRATASGTSPTPPPPPCSPTIPSAMTMRFSKN